MMIRLPKLAETKGPAPRRVQIQPYEPAPQVTPHFVVDFGTSATVIARFDTAVDATVEPEVKFLVGGTTTFPSALRINGEGNVTSVGQDAQRPGVDGVLHLSFKRHLERESRHLNADIPLLAGQVAQYIQLALKGQLPVGLTPNSHLYISVPNGFDGPAVDVIRQGVIDGLGANALPARSVHVVREGQAVAQLWQHRQMFTGQAPFVELDLGRQTGPAGQSRSDAVFLVVDVGAGTTDLTVFQSHVGGRHPAALQDLVLMNAGVPLGGTDVDHVLVASLANTGGWGDVDDTTRATALLEVRRKKEETNIEAMTTEIRQDWQPTGASEELLPAGSQRSGEDAARFANSQIDRLIALSIRGLLSLLPTHVLRRGVQAVILSGRGSLASPVRKAVDDWAASVNAPVFTLKKAYDLKLAVAYGCVALHHEDAGVSRRSIPPSTLGSALSINIDSVNHYQLAPDTWIDSEGPLLWRMPAHATSRWHLKRTQVGQKVMTTAEQELIGTVRRVTEFASREARPLFVLWAPNDRFYSPRNGHWSPVDREVVAAAADINPLTTLPFSFPATQ